MTTTDIKSQKLELIQDILALEDEKLLLLIRKLLGSALKSQESLPLEDFWQELPAQQKADIITSIRQIEAGEGIPHSTVITELKKRYAK